MVFSEDDSWTRPLGLVEREKPLVLVTYDKNIFNANDEKRRVWGKKRKLLLRLKRKGKEIIVSEFLTSVGRLRVSNSVPSVAQSAQ